MAWSRVACSTPPLPIAWRQRELGLLDVFSTGSCADRSGGLGAIPAPIWSWSAAGLCQTIDSGRWGPMHILPQGPADCTVPRRATWVCRQETCSLKCSSQPLQPQGVCEGGRCCETESPGRAHEKAAAKIRRPPSWSCGPAPALPTRLPFAGEGKGGGAATDRSPLAEGKKKEKGGEKRKDHSTMGCPPASLLVLTDGSSGLWVPRLKQSDNACGPSPALESARWDGLTLQLCLQLSEQAENQAWAPRRNGK